MHKTSQGIDASRRCFVGGAVAAAVIGCPAVLPAQTSRPTYADDFGIDSGVDDNTAAIQAAINEARVRNGYLYFPGGEFRTDTLYPSGVTMIGRGGGQVPVTPNDGASASILVLRQSGIDLLSYTGAENQVRGGTYNLNLYSDVGVRARRMISISGSTNDQPDHLRFVSGRISGYKGTLGCSNTIWGYACARRSPPIGNRGIYIQDIDVYSAHTASVVFWGFFDAVITSLHVYAGFGSPAAAGLWVGGDGVVNSRGFQVTNSKTEGPLNLANCADSRFQGQWGTIQRDMATTPNVQVDDF